MQQTVHHNPNRGTTSADVPALCRREGHAAPGRVQHHPDNSTMLSTWKKGPKGKAERQHQRSHYMVGNKTVCRDTFKFVYEQVLWPSQ